LSFYAQDYSRYADVVAQCLDSHIRKVSVSSRSIGSL
jgi:pre-mRNA cleavage complex 2 protein Pcf11